MHAKRQTEKGRERAVLGMISIMGGPGRSMVTGVASASERESARESAVLGTMTHNRGSRMGKRRRSVLVITDTHYGETREP